MDELRIMYVIYYVDIDPDTGFVSKMKPIAYADKEGYAISITKFLNTDDEEPCRTYKYDKL